MGENSYKYSEDELDVMDEVDLFLGDLNETSYGEVEIPDTLRMGIRKHVSACEVAKLESKMSAEDREYIRLGKMYKSKRKWRKYYVLAAVLVLGLVFGMTSMGGPEKVFEKFNWLLAGREQTNVDSENANILKMENVSEEEAYQEVEDKFGFLPVRMTYLPEGIEFIDAVIFEETLDVQFLYGKEGMTSIAYYVYPNYRDGSYSVGLEDRLQKEYSEIINEVEVLVKEYLVSDTGETRWTAEFSHDKISYYMVCTEMSEHDFEEILKNLYFF